MKFNFARTETAETSDDLKKLNINTLEDFLNKHLEKISFGTSIETYNYGFELFEFGGQFSDWFSKTKDILKYSHKNKYLVSVGQIDWKKYKKLNEYEQFLTVKKSILESINNLKNLKKKPKDFNFIDFKNKVEDILLVYDKEKYNYTNG